MTIRAPSIAGTFYPSERDSCREGVVACLGSSAPPEVQGRRVYGGAVPHASWAYSGPIAAQVLAVTATSASPASPRSARSASPTSSAASLTYVLFGAVHRPISHRTAVFAKGAWETPLGTVEVDTDLALELLGGCSLLTADEAAHRFEHSLEVQVPFIQHLSPGARIVPIMIQATPEAARIGKEIGELVADSGRTVSFIGSSDLTHYGPRFGFTPEGQGATGIGWAKEVNDRRMIEELLAMRADNIVPEALAHHNACGSGALAATVAACRSCGAERGVLLSHRNSAEAEAAGQLGVSAEPSDAVGYAGVVFV